MADVKISELPSASTPLAGTEQIPLVQSSTTKKITVSNLLTSANLGTPTAVNLANATNVPMAQASGILPVVNGGTGTSTPAIVAGTNVTVSGTWPNQTINATGGGGSGTVTSASVVSANGLAGTVANPTTTPAITLSTTVTGVVKGNGTALSAATAGTDYVAPGGALGTPSSGTATNLTGLPLSTGVTGTLPVANGGTGTASPALVAGTNVTITGSWPNQTINSTGGGSGMVYPGAGIPNSTGTAWGTSYTTTGTGTVVALATAAALTSPSANQINDTNGAQILGLSPTTSAVDYLVVKNGIGVGVPLHFYADGASTNIGLHIQPKGSGLVTISDGTDFNKGIRFRSSGSAASAITLLDAVATAGRVVTLPDATTTLVGRDTTDTLTNKTLTSPTLTTPILGTPQSGNFSTGTFTWPTFNQNTTGTAAGLSATLAIGSGGTGQTTAAAAITALTGTQTSGQYLRSDGTNAALGAIQAGDVPTLNQNTTGTAANVTGTVAVANGGTGATSLTANNVILGNGTSAVQVVAPGTAGNVLTSNGTTWASTTPASGGLSRAQATAISLVFGF
jgi:hypothetical protein